MVRETHKIKKSIATNVMTSLRRKEMTTTEERVSRIEGAYKHLATRADVIAVKAELAETKAAVKADVRELRSELRAMETRLLLRLGGLLIASAGATVAILRFLS